jgi:hypothetical protein
MAIRSLPSFSNSLRTLGKNHDPSLTKDLKTKIFGLNTTKLFKVDVEATRKDLPKDYLKQNKMAYLEEGPTPSHHAYGKIRT